MSAAEGSGGEAKKISGITCIKCPLKSPAFNSAFIGVKSVFHYGVLEKIMAFHHDRISDWRITVSPGAERHFKTIIERTIVTSRETIPEMALSREDAEFKDKPSDLKVEKVSSVRRLGVWARTSSLGFEGDPNFFKPMVGEKALKYPGITYFLGMYKGKPVATSLACISGKIVGIFGVSTIPEARGRGSGKR